MPRECVACVCVYVCRQGPLRAGPLLCCERKNKSSVFFFLLHLVTTRTRASRYINKHMLGIFTHILRVVQNMAVFVSVCYEIVGFSYAR